MTSSPLFGRRVETGWIDRALEGAVAGAGGAAFVAGPPGMGKTRLVEHAAARAGELGLHVAIGRAWESGGAPAGWPFVEALRSWRNHPELARACATLGPACTHLRQLHPELAPPGEPQARGDVDASARFLVFDAVADLWCELARARPCLLVLEDLHAADGFTAELLAMLCRRAAGAPLLVLGTYRSREARLSTQVGDALAQAARAAHVLDLSPLSELEARELARSALGTEISAEQVACIVEASQGNPLFVRELARASGHRGPGRALGGLDHVIAAHFGTLGPVAREVADVASIFGRSVDTAVLRRTCRAALGLDDVAISTALGELAERELLVADAGGLAFVHILVRDALHERLAPSRRESLQAAAVPQLEQVGAPASQLAHHALEAGRALPAARTIALARRAIDESTATLAFMDTPVLLARLVAAAEALAWLDPTELLELRLELAEAEIRAGRVANGRELSERVATAARALGNAELQARAALAYGAEFTRGTSNRTMMRLLEQALDSLGDALTPLRVRVLARYASALFPAADPEVPVRVAEQAIALARELGDRRALADACFYARLPLMFWRPIRWLLAFEEEALAVAREVGSPAELSRALTLKAFCHLIACDPRGYDALMTEALTLAEGMQSPQQVFRLHLLHAMGATHRGEFAEAETRLARARACTERGPVETAIPVFLLCRFCSARLRRDRDELVAMREEVTAVLGTMPSSRGIFASYHAFLGEPEAARAELAQRDVDLRGRPLALYACLAEAALAVADLDLARELYERMMPFADDVVAWGLMGFSAEGVAHGWLGRLAEALGRREQADHHFARAVELDRACGARPSLANVLEDWGDVLVARGDPSAVDCFSQATALLDELGLHARAQAIRTRRPAPAEGPSAPPSEPARAAVLDLQRMGDVVVVTFGRERFSVRDSKGMRYLELLVRAAGSEIHALELIASDAGLETPAAFGGDAGPMLDAKAKGEYRERVRSLQEELAEAEDFGDLARAERLRAELDAIVSELSRATGLGGRDRDAVSPAERARINVQRRLKAAVSALARHSPALDEHLERALRTGVFCRYDPPARP